MAPTGITARAPGISGVYLDTGCLGSGVLECLDELDMEHPWALLQQLGVAAEKMGGSSGGVYSLLFTAAASAFQVL